MPETATYVSLAVVVAVLATHFLDQPFLQWLPATSIFLLLGIVIGAIVRASDAHHFTEFQPHVFFTYLLPPIIFQAGLGLMKKDFFKNFGTINVLAMLGTCINAAILFGLLSVLAADMDSLVAGSLAVLLSATDPVAVLSVFEKYSNTCERTVYSIILGESLLNDAVCVVLYTALQSFRHNPNVLRSIGQFIYLLLVSPVLALAFSVGLCLLLKHVNLRSHVAMELSLVALLGAYLPYLVAELVGLSAIVAVFTCGIVAKHYTTKNLSPIAQEGLASASVTLSFVAEMMVFLYIGVGVTGSRDLKWHWGFIFGTIGSCLLARAVCVFVLLPLCNRKRRRVLETKHMFAVWYSGLRGAIAFALAVELSDRDPDSRIVTTALAVVLFTTFVLGGLADYTYKSLNLVGDNVQQIVVSKGHSGVNKLRFHDRWKHLDEHTIQPAICLSREELSELSPGPEMHDIVQSHHPGRKHATLSAGEVRHEAGAVVVSSRSPLQRHLIAPGDGDGGL